MYEYLYKGIILFDAQISSCTTSCNGKIIDKQKKQLAADEFFERYNTNHFTDLIK